MAISHLISKITEDAQEEAKIILEKASVDEKEIMQKKIVEAKYERDVIIERAQREAKSKAERIVSHAELKVRNDKLAAKQKMIQKVFDLVLEKLNNLSSEELVGFIKKSVLEASFEGEAELILSKEYKEKIKKDFEKEINKDLKKMDRQASITISAEDRQLASEFILSQRGIEMNYTFKALVSSLKEEMEFEITKILFQ